MINKEAVIPFVSGLAEKLSLLLFFWLKISKVMPLYGPKTAVCISAQAPVLLVPLPACFYAFPMKTSTE
jgi:hypothetical protein